MARVNALLPASHPETGDPGHKPSPCDPSAWVLHHHKAPSPRNASLPSGSGRALRVDFFTRGRTAGQWNGSRPRSFALTHEGLGLRTQNPVSYDPGEGRGSQPRLHFKVTFKDPNAKATLWDLIGPISGTVTQVFVFLQLSKS